jgi:hypothetical protein
MRILGLRSASNEMKVALSKVDIVTRRHCVKLKYGYPYYNHFDSVAFNGRVLDTDLSIVPAAPRRNRFEKRLEHFSTLLDKLGASILLTNLYGCAGAFENMWADLLSG